MRVFKMPQSFAYNPGQPRDERGRWTSGGGAAPADVARFEGVFGSGDVDAVFGGALQTTTPFPAARRLKTEPRFDRAKVAELLRRPVELTSIDPRVLRSNQPSVTRDGVAYYLTDEYARTGRTFADQGDPGNRFPIVERRERTGEYVIVSGHHRATAALIRGDDLQVRIAR